MSMEGRPSKESQEDVLIRRAAHETAQYLSRDPKLAKLGASTSELEKHARGKIESLVGMIKDRLRHNKEYLASREAHTQEYLLSRKTQLEERLGRFEHRPHFEEIAAMEREIYEELAKTQLAVYKEQSKLLEDTALKVGVEMFKGFGVAEETATALFREIQTQEEKVVSFPKG